MEEVVSLQLLYRQVESENEKPFPQTFTFPAQKEKGQLKNKCFVFGRSPSGYIRKRKASELEKNEYIGIKMQREVNPLSLSRVCASITEAQGDYLLEDLGSFSGMYLNGSRIISGTKYHLSRGDQISFGELNLSTHYVSVHTPELAL